MSQPSACAATAPQEHPKPTGSNRAGKTLQSTWRIAEQPARGRASQRNPATEHLQLRNDKDVTQPLEVILWKMSAWALKGFL